MLRLLVALIALSCSLSAFANTEVSFRGRTFDLAPVETGFPFVTPNVFASGGKLFYVRVGDRNNLMTLDLGDGTRTLDLTQGKLASDYDFAKRTYWNPGFRKTDGKLYWLGDEANDEIINIYRVDPATRGAEKLTNVPYVYGWSFDPKEERIAYVARLSNTGPSVAELRIYDLATGAERVVLKDAEIPGFSLTWSVPAWHPEGKGVVVNANRAGDRNQGNLIYVDFSGTSSRVTFVTDPAVPRKSPVALKNGFSSSEILFANAESGYSNIHRYTLANDSRTAITNLTQAYSSVLVTRENGKARAWISMYHPVGDELRLYDLETGALLKSQRIDGALAIHDAHEGKLYAILTSNKTPFELKKIEYGASGITLSTLSAVPATTMGTMVGCSVVPTQIPTFDNDESGARRMLHAFVYSPIEPVAPENRTAMIEAFYGGGNAYSKSIQTLCKAGITVVSPSPRGTAGFGARFEGLNDKDLGGNEIIDIIYVAQHVSRTLQIPPARIGAFGTSHGGYATMRLLTFPGEINGTRASFDWGFGVATAGFSDILHFYGTTNIPDWVILEAGDPATDEAKLRDRSPLTHADKLVGSLLLIHGTNDNRVTVAESRMMDAKLRSLGKPVTFLEYAGEGHGVKKFENRLHMMRNWFGFMERQIRW